MADQEWSEGPTLKFLADEPYPCGSNFQLFLATVGDSLVAVFKQGHEGHYCVIYMSTLVDNEWSEPIAIDHNPGEEIFSMVALDENHFALQHITMVSQTEFIEVINIETASVVAMVPTDRMCYDGFCQAQSQFQLKSSWTGWLYSQLTPDKRRHPPDKQRHLPDKRRHLPDKRRHLPDKRRHPPDKRRHLQKSKILGNSNDS